jgi:hypothetical protein
MLLLGTLTLILCHRRIYALTGLFVLGCCQLFITIITLVVFCLMLFVIRGKTQCSRTTFISRCCRFSEPQLILMADLFLVFVTFWIIIVNFVVIRNARRPPTNPVTSPYTAYAPQAQPMPISYHNPYATSINQWIPD